MTNQRPHARDVAELAEVAGFAGFLELHVEQGGYDEELDAAMRALVRTATRAGIGPAAVVGAIELVGCDALQRDGPDRLQRVDRYTDAMAALLRHFLNMS